MTLFKTIFTGIIMAKVTGIIFSILEFRKIVPPSHRKIAAKTSLPKSAGDGKRSTTISENAVHRNGTLFNQTQDEPTKILPIKGAYDPDTADQSHVVPDTVQYQVPFDLAASKTPKNAIPNEMEKKMERLEKIIRLENNKIKQELKEMRDEMKHHRKWY